MERFIQKGEASVGAYLLEHASIDHKKIDTLPLLLQSFLSNSRVQRGVGIHLGFSEGRSTTDSHALRIKKADIHVTAGDNDSVAWDIVTYPGHRMLLRLSTILSKSGLDDM